MYWSPAMILRPMQVSPVAAIRRPSDRARCTRGLISRSMNPACSMIAAKPMAPRISQTVVSMLVMPPRENRALMVSLELLATCPVAMDLDRFDAVEHRPLAGLVDQGLDHFGLGERRQDPGEQGGAEDRQERRHLDR